MTLKILVVMGFLTLAYEYVECSQSKSTAPQICTEHVGCVIGKLMPGYQTDYFEAFLGVPYAVPPVGDLRFSNPQPFSKCDETIDATEAKPDCIQKSFLTSEVTGSEDCLYLNIYRPVPSERNNQLKPVMAYIHRGGFFMGSVNPKALGPQYFMHTKKVILVTVAYRLGVMGFLSTKDSFIPGNMGMKDQRMALVWIKQNIQDFGGDPNQVTLFGLSAGGISTHLHMLSENSQGLFQRVISLSGMASSPIAFQRNPLEIVRQTAENCNIQNFEGLTTPQLLEALRAVPAETLVNADNHLRFWEKEPLAVYVLVVENSNENDTFLNRPPAEIMTSGDYQAVPFLAGVVPEEGAMRSAAIWENVSLRNSFDKNFDNLLEDLLSLPTHLNRSRLEYIMCRVIEEYFDGHHHLTRQGLLEILTDYWFHYPLYRDSKAFIHHFNDTKKPLYLHRFNYSGPNSFVSSFSGGFTDLRYGVIHADNVFYFFNTSIPDFPKTSQDAHAVQGYVNFLVEFAINGKSFVGMECNASNFPYNSDDSICEYVTFENGPSDEFVIGTDNKFPTRRMRLWEELLKE